ncbi:MAG: DUF1259 domain-containing protein, partial [Opitutaceae bacterium]
WTMPPFMGLTSWAAFMPGEKTEVMVMGDLVLFEDEVNPVMSVAHDSGLTVTALHNHFFYDQPRVYFMHLGGEGSVEQLAGGVKAAFARVDEIRAAQKTPARSFGRPIPTTNTIEAAPLAQILSAEPQARDGMAKFVFGRTARMACGCEVGAEMGVNTWAAFAGTMDDAVVDGDFAVLEDELQAVLKSLRGEGINIVAIHHHMTHETPRILFLHYWGRGAAEALARSLRKTLDVQSAATTDTRHEMDHP